MSKNILFLNQISRNDIFLCGGKGAQLGELLKIGVPVPEAFVLTTKVYKRFLIDNGLVRKIKDELTQVNIEDSETVEFISGRIRNLIVNGQLDDGLQKEILKNFDMLRTDYIAVRSSATAEDTNKTSFAGQLSTFLNTTKKDLLDNIKQCWASLFSSRALHYRVSHGLEKKEVLVAVIVQKMVDAEVSGVTFTAHPVIKDSNIILIEAGWGLGETLVSGMITPDHYVVDKRNFDIYDFKIGKQKKMIDRKDKTQKIIDIPKAKQSERKLSEDKAIKIAKLCLQIEKHYKFPQDIEWAISDDKLFILQSRPITTL